ncbi:hypothetical protein AAG906_024491 [Vitis piasezkii]
MAPFFGFLDTATTLVFSCMGVSYGTAKSGVGVASMGVMRSELVMKSIVPVVMAGVNGASKSFTRTSRISSSGGEEKDAQASDLEGARGIFLEGKI